MARQLPREKAIHQLPTGYEGTNVSTDVQVPQSGIVDVDRGVFNLFDKDLVFLLKDPEAKGGAKKVPVIFATGERFALLKRKDPIRDKNGTLILPLISIKRTGIELRRSGYGLQADLGDLAIKKRISSEDPTYQSLINKLGLKNQKNVAPPGGANDSQKAAGGLSTRRIRGRLTMEARSGDLLANDLGNNIIEIITMPFPKFCTLSYEVTFWTQYVGNMNKMIENLIQSVEVMGFNFKIQSDKGYWYVAHLEDSLNSADNFENFSDQERMIRYSFNLKVDSWIAAVTNPGMQSPVRKYLSAPQLNFVVNEVNAPVTVQTDPPQLGKSGDLDRFILSDVDTIDSSGEPILSGDPVVTKAFDVIKDPFDRSGKGDYFPVLTRNNRGETVFSTRIVSKIDEFSY